MLRCRCFSPKPVCLHAAGDDGDGEGGHPPHVHAPHFDDEGKSPQTLHFEISGQATCMQNLCRKLQQTFCKDRAQMAHKCTRVSFSARETPRLASSAALEGEVSPVLCIMGRKASGNNKFRRLHSVVSFVWQHLLRHCFHFVDSKEFSLSLSRW